MSLIMRMSTVAAFLGLLGGVSHAQEASPSAFGTMAANAQPTTSPKKNIRKGLFHTTPSSNPSGANADDENAAMFSLGSAFGLSFSSDDPSTFKVENNIVVYDEERTKTRPAVFVLPSICLVGTPGKSLSAIVPVNLNTSAQSDLGVGVSFGFSTGPKASEKKTFEIGIGVVAVWSDVTRLTSQQQQSFAGETQLPAGASTDFRKAKRPSLAVVVYLVPLF